LSKYFFKLPSKHCSRQIFKKKGLFMASKFILLSFLLIASIFTIQESQAQWGGSQGSGIPGMPGMKRGAGRNASNPDTTSTIQNSHIATPAPGSHLLTYEQIETNLSRLEESLKLTAEQNKAWGNFATKVRSYASDVAKERARLNNDSPTTVDALKYLSQSAEDAKNRYTSLKEIDEAAKPLYKLLNSEQKTVFDNRIPTFVAARPKRLGNNQPNLNLPDLGGSPAPAQNSGSNSLPGYIHQ
jgi:hypothetical protein